MFPSITLHKGMLGTVLCHNMGAGDSGGRRLRTEDALLGGSALFRSRTRA